MRQICVFWMTDMGQILPFLVGICESNVQGLWVFSFENLGGNNFLGKIIFKIIFRESLIQNLLVERGYSFAPWQFFPQGSTVNLDGQPGIQVCWLLNWCFFPSSIPRFLLIHDTFLSETGLLNILQTLRIRSIIQALKSIANQGPECSTSYKGMRRFISIMKQPEGVELVLII